MKLLLLRGYNNYHNRILKEAPSVASYRGFDSYDYGEYNFNLNDGINTKITLNFTDEAYINYMADYVVCYEVVNNIEVIQHRWFVIEQEWNREGQYKVQLRRDVLVDFKLDYHTSPMLINKGYPTSGSTEIYNSEGLQYSQIKKYQIDLEESALNWIVIYLNKSRRGIPFPNPSDSMESHGNGYPVFWSDGEYTYNSASGEANIPRESVEIGDFVKAENYYAWVKSRVANFGDGINSSLYLGDSAGNAEYFRPLGQGITEEAAYDIIAFPYSEGNNNIMLSCTDAEGQAVSTIIGPRTAFWIAMNLKYIMQEDVYDIQLLPFCPIDGIQVERIDIDGRLYENVQIPQALYDDLIKMVRIDLSFKVEDINYDESGDKIFKAKFNRIDYARPIDTSFFGLFCSKASRIIHVSLQYPYSTNTTELKKVDSECRFLRICSPAGKSMWDYNFTKNGCEEFSFSIYTTLKPGQPYMHIRPSEFGGLYNERFIDDTRGLIDTSSYSLSTVVDSWMSYLQQNSNYQDIFNRQIDSLEVQHKQALIGDIAGALTGTVGGVAIGATLGAGAAIMGAASAVGGVADIFLNQQLRNEQISLTKDMHSMNLEQIKARPDTLTKVSNIDIDSHLVPYIEIYSASDDEIQYLKKLLYYRGYTINRIDTFDNMYTNAFMEGAESAFISGRLIECTGLQEDAHVLSELNNELQIGVRVIL